jgi:hypothetical protein
METALVALSTAVDKPTVFDSSDKSGKSDQSDETNGA